MSTPDKTYHLKGKALTDDDRMPFGKHKGERMEDVPASYLLWLWNQGCADHGGVRGYIVNSFDALVMDAPDVIVTPPTQRDQDLYK